MPIELCNEMLFASPQFLREAVREIISVFEETKLIDAFARILKLVVSFSISVKSVGRREKRKREILSRLDLFVVILPLPLNQKCCLVRCKYYGGCTYAPSILRVVIVESVLVWVAGGWGTLEDLPCTRGCSHKTANLRHIQLGRFSPVCSLSTPSSFRRPRLIGLQCIHAERGPEGALCFTPSLPSSNYSHWHCRRFTTIPTGARLSIVRRAGLTTLNHLMWL